MSRPKGARGKKHVIPERLEKDAIQNIDLETVAPNIEEKFKNFPPVRDTEKEKNILKKMENIDDLEEDENEEEDQDQDQEEEKSSRPQMPLYLRNMPEGSDKSKHIIAAAQAAIILGTPVRQVALQYGINHSKVIEWQHTLITVGAIGRRDRLSEMLMSYIEQEMKSLMAISIITSDEDWVMRQDAGELAHFIAVKSDRLLMLLQAFGRVDSSRDRYEQQLKVLADNA